MRRSKTILASVALAGALASVFAAAPPATAANHDGNPDPREVILNQDAGFDGAVYDAYFEESSYVGKKYIGTNINLNDSASSVWSYDHLCTTTIYKNTGFVGPQWTLSRYPDDGYLVSNLSDVGLNNAVSSHAFCRF